MHLSLRSYNIYYTQGTEMSDESINHAVICY